MPDFLLELRSEEIPARMQARARDDLAKLFAAEIAKAGLTASALTTYATPRRLALIARDLPLETPAIREDTKGPRASAPPQALEGFLRKTGLTREQITERDGVLFAVADKPGRATAAVLAEAIPAIIRAFPWPKSMRWGVASASTESLRWVRPLQGIVALLGDEVVDCAIADIRSGAATFGHRFHHPGPITIGSAADYVEKLRMVHVIVDQDERAAIIRDGARAAAGEAGLALIDDDALVAENAGLTEWPVPLLGQFDPAFLEVPPEVIQLTARVNQKYFVCRAANGALANAFVCTANIAAADGGAKIVAGNRKVLAARLADARFFYEADAKVPLETHAAKLDKLVFHEKLGTVADKVERVARLARWLVEEGIVGPAEDRERLATLAERAARLCKADLVTGMVGEFPELQGVMGGYYTRAQGEPDEVWQAVRDHYKPVGQGDEVPTAPVTVAVSLADKLDTIIEFYGSQQRPSGSKDQYGIRRAALGAIRVILANAIRLPIDKLTGFFFWLQIRTWNASIGQRAYGWGATFETLFHAEDGQPCTLLERTFFDIESHADHLDELNEIEFITAHRVNYHDDGNSDLEEAVVGARAYVIPDWRILRAEIVPFFADRLKVQQREAGVRHDLIDAVFALGGEDDLVRLLARVRALQAFVATPEGENLLAGYKRAANILKKEGWDASLAPVDGAGPSAAPGLASGSGGAAPSPAEAALTAALDAAEPAAADAISREDFGGAMAALASLRAPIDTFFEAVTVNDPDPATRSRRLDLLARVRSAVHRVADFSKIEG